ncbi:4682_t:CDS:1, partial [Funneliformis caledonium]
MHKVLVPISSVSSACKTRGDTSASGTVFEMTFCDKNSDLMLSGEGFG